MNSVLVSYSPALHSCIVTTKGDNTLKQYVALKGLHPNKQLSRAEFMHLVKPLGVHLSCIMMTKYFERLIRGFEVNGSLAASLLRTCPYQCCVNTGDSHPLGRCHCGAICQNQGKRRKSQYGHNGGFPFLFLWCLRLIYCLLLICIDLVDACGAMSGDCQPSLGTKLYVRERLHSGISY